MATLYIFPDMCWYENFWGDYDVEKTCFDALIYYYYYTIITAFFSDRIKPNNQNKVRDILT